MASSPFQTFVLETDQMSMLRSYKTNVELREGLIDGLNTVLYGRIDHAIVLTQFRGLNGFLRVEMTGNNGTRPLRSSTSNAGLDGFFFDYDGGWRQSVDACQICIPCRWQGVDSEALG